MKKTIIVLLLLTMLTAVGFPSFLYALDETPSHCVSFQRHKKMKSHLLSKLSSVLRKKTRVLFVEGERTTPIKLKESPDIHNAVKNCTPIVISRPTKAQLQSLAGIGIGPCEAAIVKPNKQGNEFKIYIIRGKEKDKKRIRALQRDEERDRDLDAQVHSIKTIIDDSEVERSIVREEPFNGEDHKRWTILDVDPYFWGKQEQFIHVGYQVDLYYVINPGPRKYVTVQTVGTGVSAGELAEDSRFRRGLFQAQVSVSLEDLDYDNWRGNRLKLERYAPESENHSNATTVTTGATFTTAALPGLTFTGMPYVNNYSGFALSYLKGETCSFHDFTVNFDPVRPLSPSRVQWTYWLSGASGAKLRKKHQGYDLVEYTGIRELPELAAGSVLMPHLEAVYYADGEETGTVSFLGTVRQKLLGIKNYVVRHSVEEKTDYVNHFFSIDFSQVHS